MTADLAHHWDQALAAIGTATSAGWRYVSALRAFLAWHEAQVGRPFDPRRIELDLAAYHCHRQALGHPPGTINLVVVALRWSTDWLVEIGLWDEATARRFKLIGALVPEALTPAALDALAQAIQRGGYAARGEALLQLLLQTDILPSECEALRVSDLTLGLDAGQLVAQASQQPRVLALNAWARAALARYLAERWDVVEGMLATCVECGLVPVGTSLRALRAMVAATYLGSQVGEMVENWEEQDAG